MKSYSFSKLVVRSFPTVCDINNPYIFTSDVRVIVNVSEHPYTSEIASLLEARGIRTYFFPLVEEGPDMGLENLLSAVRVLTKEDGEGNKVILHCMGGNNRSRTVAEAFCFHKTGEHFEDEYKGYFNHLLYNSANGHLPCREELEAALLF